MQRATLSVGILLAFATAALPVHAVSFSAAHPDYEVGSTPLSVVAVDLDGDGHIDLATANQDSGDISILINDGTGNFLPAVNYIIGDPDLAAPSAIAVGDFNGDTKPDLVVTDNLGSTVVVLLNEGGGVFGPPIVTATGMEPEALVVADFNNDSKADVATANALDDTVTVLFGTNDGRFSSTCVGGGNAGNSCLLAEDCPDGSCPVQNIAVDQAPTGLAVADLNTDTFVDIVVANSSGGAGSAGSITVLKGSATGTFTAQVPAITAAALNVPVAIAAGDLNHDTKVDVAVVNEDGDSVAVFLGNGDLSFGGATQYDIGSFPEGLTFADFDGDGNLDIASSGSFDDNVNVLIGTGDGAFLPAQNFPTGSSPFGVAGADVNGDGKLDLIVTNADDSTVTVLLNTSVVATLAQAAAVGATSLVFTDASGLPRAGALQMGGLELTYRGKTGNTITLVAPLAQAIDQGGRVTLIGALGDCDASGHVTADDLVIMTAVAAGQASLDACRLGDNNQDGRISVDELLTAVNIAAE